jgi:hypothetical protein
MPVNPNAALLADIKIILAERRAEEAARRAEAHARGEAVYPEPGFKASRLVEPEMLGDFGYLTGADLRRQRRYPTGPEADPREEEALERAAMKALKARRGCPAWVAQDYVDVLRRQGEWWKDIPL